MRARSSSQGLGAGIHRGIQENAVPESPAPHPAPLSPDESTIKYKCRDYDLSLSEIIALPKITGIAVVVAVGNEIECIRSMGDAPPIGSRGQTGVGLTGICFSTGKIELCNDVENDSRADLQACADLGVRSVLVVPIWHSSRVAGVVETLSSKANAFDWRIIRRIRRAARAFEPLALESSALSPVGQHRLEEATCLSAGGQNNEFELQKVASSAWLSQNRLGVSPTGSAREDRGKKFGDGQKECQEGERTVAALQPVEELPSRRYVDPASEAREDAAQGFLASEEEFEGKGRRRRFVSSVIVLVILFVCFFEFRTHLLSLRALIDLARLPANLVPAAASRKTPRNDLPAGLGPGSQMRVKASVPKPRAAIPQPAAGAAARFERPEQNDDPAASWQLGMAYLNGVGVQQDEHQAAKWLKKASNLGDPRAQTALSDLYFKGIGVHRDYVKAYTWATIASGQVGAENQRLASLRQRMTKSELEDANRRIQTWFRAQGRLR